MAEHRRAAEETRSDQPQVAIIKKYANRRLYNTATSSYVTLEDLGRMVRAGQDFVVYDARTGEDITRSVLTQIILEEDARGRNPLPIGFLRQLIALYDDSLRTILPRYLELSLENFARHQEQLRAYMERTLGPLFPAQSFEELARQNLAMFQRAAAMFAPFASGGDKPHPGEAQEAPSASAAGGEQETGQLAAEVRALREQVEALQRRLAELGDEGRARGSRRRATRGRGEREVG